MSIKAELKLMVARKSRINPIRYFSYLGVAYLVMFVVMAIVGFLLGVIYSHDIEKATQLAAEFHTLILQTLYFLVNLWWLARRLHDLNISGWWVLLPLLSLFSLMLVLILNIPLPQMLNMALFVLGAGSLLVLTIIGIFPGKKEINHYGPPPPINTIFNYVFFVVFVLMFFGYFIWRLIVLFTVRG